MLKIITNPDKEYAKKIRERLKDNDNYCPCASHRSLDTKCMCKSFREMFLAGETGSCGCGLYVIVEKHDELKED